MVMEAHHLHHQEGLATEATGDMKAGKSHRTMMSRAAMGAMDLVIAVVEAMKVTGAAAEVDGGAEQDTEAVGIEEAIVEATVLGTAMQLPHLHHTTTANQLLLVLMALLLLPHHITQDSTKRRHQRIPALLHRHSTPTQATATMILRLPQRLRQPVMLAILCQIPPQQSAIPMQLSLEEELMMRRERAPMEHIPKAVTTATLQEARLPLNEKILATIPTSMNDKFLRDKDR